MDGALGRRCGLLHDIGKAADHEMEGGHPAIGADLTKRYGEPKEVIHAALGHHDDLRTDTPYTVLVAAADAISASRPGARRETLDKYVRRLEDLEALAYGFPGVEQAYAIQAGREIRVIADSHRLGDEAAAKLCRDIAKAVQEQLTYPGEVKVTVLRETRSVEFARCRRTLPRESRRTLILKEAKLYHDPAPFRIMSEGGPCSSGPPRGSTLADQETLPSKLQGIVTPRPEKGCPLPDRALADLAVPAPSAGAIDEARWARIRWANLPSH